MVFYSYFFVSVYMCIYFLTSISVAEKVYEPEITPSDATYKIETNGNVNVTCKSPGFLGDDKSYLTWYKEDETGNRVPVDRSRIIRFDEQVKNAGFLDVEILTFRRFTDALSGRYVCVRKMEDNDPTEKTINIALERE